MARKNIQHLLIVALLNTVALALCGFLFFEVKASNERVSTLANNIELQAKQENTLKNVKALVEEITPFRAELERYFVSADGAAAFIEFLESVGKRAKVAVTIQAVEESALDGSEKLMKLVLALTADGAWEDVAHFLGLLELLPYESSVGELVFSRKDSGSWRLDAKLEALKIL